MNDAIGEDKFLNAKQTAAVLNVPVSWVYAKAESGVLPSYKLGKYLRFKPSEVEKWMEKHRRKGEGANA